MAVNLHVESSVHALPMGHAVRNTVGELFALTHISMHYAKYILGMCSMDFALLLTTPSGREMLPFRT